MSTGKGGKRISVFDRLGPGTDEPSGSSHRRFSSDKGGHGDKGRHGHARSEEPLRERKPSHTEYDEKKYLHYRGESAPQPPARGRHRQYQASESDHSGEEAAAGKKGTSRVKPREGPPGGPMKESYYKHVLHEERSGRGGGVRVKRREVSESDSLSDGESGGEEGKRKRPHRTEQERRSKSHGLNLETGGVPSRHSSGMEGGGVPSRHSSGMEGGGVPSRHSSGMEGGGVPSRHSSGMEGGGVPSRHSLGSEGSGVPSRHSLGSEGGGVPSRHSLGSEGGGVPSRHSLGSEGGGVPEDGRRLSKHLERREKVPERLPHLERSGSLSGSMEPKLVRVKPPESKEGVYHKRKREEDHPEMRHPPPDRERKRKYEDVDPVGLPEPKRARISESYLPLKEVERQRFKETEERYRPKEFDPGDRKRKYEGREPLPKKRMRSHTPEGLGSRRHGKPISPSVKESIEQRRGRERERKSDDSLSETDSTAEGTGAVVKKLDWSSLCALSSASPPPVKTSALERFTPGSLFSRIGVSPSLAGEQLFKKISSLVSKHLKKSQQHLDPQNVNLLPESFTDDPFDGVEFGSAGAFRIRDQQNLTRIFSDIGPCRRGLTAAADFAMRQKLRKVTREPLPSSQLPTNWEDSEHYSTGVALYQSMGKKASGKPAYRLEPSLVGSLIISR